MNISLNQVFQKKDKKRFALENHKLPSKKTVAFFKIIRDRWVSSFMYIIKQHINALKKKKWFVFFSSSLLKQNTSFKRFKNKTKHTSFESVVGSSVERMINWDEKNVNFNVTMLWWKQCKTTFCRKKSFQTLKERKKSRLSLIWHH